MDLILCWLIGPAALILVAVGLSFGVELITDTRVPWGVRPGLGLATMILVAQLGAYFHATAELAIPVAVALGAFGLLMGWSARLTSEPLPGWSILAAVGVFFVFGAPVILSGDPTWAGYIKLDDTATWMGLTDHAFEFGSRTEDFPPSTWEALVNVNPGYPIGSFVPMATISKLVGQDVAWTVQPSMAVMAVILTLLLAELVRPLVRLTPARAAIAFLGAQSAILLGYSLWGGLKEVAAATLLPLAPLLAWHAIRKEEARWPWILPGIAIAALLGILGPGGAAWPALTMLPVLVEAWRRIGGTKALLLAAKTIGFAVVVSIPVLITVNGLYDPFASFLFEETELGNLRGPLDFRHVIGIWPANDFRVDPHANFLVTIVAIVLACTAVFAVYNAVKDRELPFAGYVAGGFLAFLALYKVGSPWVDGKAMVMVSPALLTAGMAGIAILIQRTRFNIESWLIGTFAAAMVLWGSVLAYTGVWLAPRGEHEELEQIGEEFSGRGPALEVEGSLYGARHFLRDLDAENARDLRRRSVLLRDGSLPDEVGYLDTDQIADDQLAPYRLLVFRRSPVASRPPGNFRLVYAGTYYEVWERIGSPEPGRSLLERLPLGEPPASSAVPDCGQVQALAERAGPDGILRAAIARESSLLNLDHSIRPEAWAVDGTIFTPDDSGNLETTVAVPVDGSYLVWVGGDIHRELTVNAGGHTATGVHQALNVNRYEPFGPFELTAGDEELQISSKRSGLAPGSGTTPSPIGPVILQRVEPDDPGTITVDTADYAQLCGVPWDWIEVYA